MHKDKNVWTNKYGDNVDIQEMETYYLRNTIRSINKMINSKKIDKYPIQYDVLFDELASRGYDTDFELDEIYKGLDKY